jgi:hypothetical protein
MSIIDILSTHQHLAELATDVQNSELFTILIQIAAYVTPYFLIPATFKFGLGIFGNLAGMINDRSRGLFDRQRKFRAGSRAKMRERARNEKRFQGGNANNWRGKVNRGIARGMNADSILESGALFSRPGSGAWKGAIDARQAALRRVEKEKAEKENLLYQTWKHDDEVSKAADNSYDAGSLRANLQNIDRKNLAEAIKAGKEAEFVPRFEGAALEETVASVEAVRRGMSPQAFKRMVSKGSIAGGTAHADAFETLRSAALSSGTDASTLAAAVSETRSDSMNAGRLESGGAGFGATLGAVQKIQQAYAAAGPDGLTPAAEAALRKEVNKTIYREVLESQGPSTLAHPSLKPKAVEELSPELFSMVEEAATESGTAYAAATTEGEKRQAERKIMQKLANVSAVHDSIGGAGSKKGAILADNVLEKTLAWDQLPKSLQDLAIARYGSEYSTTERRPSRVMGDDGVEHEVMRDVTVAKPPAEISVQRLMEAARGNEQFQQLHKEYSTDIERRKGMPLSPGEVGGGAATSPTTPPLG